MFIEMSLSWLLALIIAPIVLLLIVGCILFFVLKKKKPKLVIDDEYVNELINAFGGISNIKEVNTENGGRVAILVLDLDKLNLEGIKALATSGVFVTGNTVKTLYREDSQAVKNAIEKRI